jgi:hypothetical protein
MSTRRIAVVGIACACLLPLSGCGKKVVSQSTVETDVARDLAASAKQHTLKVSCPDDLDAKVGAQMTCTVTQGQKTTYPVTVTVRSITNSVVHFDSEVGFTKP